MLWDIQKEIFCQQLAQISLQRANNCLYSGRFWFKMPKKHKTSQKVAECKVENLLLSNITSTEVYVQYGCNKFQAQLRLRFHTISPIVRRNCLRCLLLNMKKTNILQMPRMKNRHTLGLITAGAGTKWNSGMKTRRASTYIHF